MKLLLMLLGVLGLILLALPVLVGAVLATYPWMAGREALQAQTWSPRVGSVAAAAAPIEQWPLIVDTATGSSCGVTAEDLAAIAKTESDFGRNMATNATGHFGYGQFDAATWATFGKGDPNSPADALTAIARTLCGRGYGRNRTAALNSYGGCTTSVCLGTTDYASQITQLGASYAQLPQPAVGAGADVLAIAHDWLGVPYHFGRCTRSGIDCSCLMVQIFAAVGVHLPRTAAEQYAAIPHVAADQAQPGDLVFFADTYMLGISHVGLYLGNGQQINAPTEGQVVSVQPVFSGYWGQHLAGFGRVPRVGQGGQA
jgi:cell wall-associated NlpC family hydrolase